MKTIITLFLCLVLLGCNNDDPKPYPVLQSGNVLISPIPEKTYDEIMSILQHTKMVSVLAVGNSDYWIVIFANNSQCAIDNSTKRRILG